MEKSTLQTLMIKIYVMIHWRKITLSFPNNNLLKCQEKYVKNLVRKYEICGVLYNVIIMATIGFDLIFFVKLSNLCVKQVTQIATKHDMRLVHVLWYEILVLYSVIIFWDEN